MNVNDNSQEQLALNIALPSANVRFLVSPISLAPWSQLFWQHFPTHNSNPDLTYSLQQSGDQAIITTPAGSQTCTLKDAHALWDVTFRNVLRQAGGSALLHGGLVLDKNTAILILGESGAGKSTLVNTLVNRGCSYATDEFLCIREQGVSGLPRGFEWQPSHVPEDAIDTWSYPIEATNHPPLFGYRPRFLGSVELKWPLIRAVVILSTTHTTGATDIKKIAPLLDPHWLNKPLRRDHAAVRILARKPFYLVTGGNPDQIAETCLKLVL